MKKFYLLLLPAFFILTSFTTKIYSAKVSDEAIYFSSPHVEELIIEIPKINEKNQADIQAAIVNAGGITFAGYCEKNKMMLFYVDRDIQANNTFLDTVMMPLGIDYNVKIGVSIKMLEADCGIYTESDPTLSNH